MCAQKPHRGYLHNAHMRPEGEGNVIRKSKAFQKNLKRLKTSQNLFEEKIFATKKAAPRVAFHIVCFQNAHFWVRKEMTSSAFMRTCSMLSLSRTVTVPSSSVVKSMVRQ